MSGSDEKKKIWDFFKTYSTYSDYGIAALMGNFEAESNCEPIRLQGDFSSNRAKSIEHARKVDSGEITPASFDKNSLGWGLAQWTHPVRKANLITFCKSNFKSIGDLNAQCQFALREIETEYKTVKYALDYADDVRSASDIVLKIYENPAVQTEAVKVARAKLGQAIYDEFHGLEIEIPVDALGMDNFVVELKALLAKYGY